MTKQNNENRHKMLCDEIHDLYIRKNRDYGNSFHDTFEEEGMAMSRIRLSDKLSRFKNLTKKAVDDVSVTDESIRDTLIDLANYAIMTVMEMDIAVEASLETPVSTDRELEEIVINADRELPIESKRVKIDDLNQ